MRKSKSVFAITLLLIVSLVGCNSWPTIIATAEAIASITSIFYPGVGSLSALAVSLLQQAEAAAQAYSANKNTSTEAAYVAAIQAIETQLPADLQALNIPAADQQKVSAAVNIILDYVEALGVKTPATSAVIVKARMARGVAPAPKPLTRAQILTRWKALCNGDQKCLALVK